MFERNTHKLSEPKKKKLLLQLFNGDYLDKMGYFLLRDKPNACYDEVKGLVAAFRKSRKKL
jgi:hypothetical protein